MNSEYYNYYRPRKRLWWLPLAVLLLCVLGYNVYRAVRPNEGESTAADTSSLRQDGNLRTAELDGTRVWVLDREYAGDYALQRIRIVPEGETREPLYGVTDLPAAEPRAAAEAFSRQEVMDPAQYAAFCAELGVEPAFDGQSGAYLVLAAAGPGTEGLDFRLADVRVDGDAATVFLRAAYTGSGPDAAAWVLTVPAEASVRRVTLVPVLTQEEFEALAAPSAAAP